jgi:hypothetical protein
MAGGCIHNDFWVEQTLCAGCGQTDPNGALPLVAMPGEFRFIGPSNMSYSVMNFIGSTILTVIVVIEV